MGLRAGTSVDDGFDDVVCLGANLDGGAAGRVPPGGVDEGCFAEGVFAVDLVGFCGGAEGEGVVEGVFVVEGVEEDGGLAGGVDLVGVGMGDLVGVGIGDFAFFGFGMGETKGDDVGAGIGEVRDAGGFKDECGGFRDLEAGVVAGDDEGVEERGGERSSGGGFGFAIFEGREEDVDTSRVRFFAGGSAVGGERSKVGESSSEGRGGVDERGGVAERGGVEEGRGGVAAEVDGRGGVAVREGGGGGLDAGGGRSMRGLLRFSPGSIGMISFRFFVDDARVLSHLNQK